MTKTNVAVKNNCMDGKKMRTINDCVLLINTESSKNEVSLYDSAGNLIIEKKKTIEFMTEELIRAKSFDGKYTLHNIKGKMLLPFECKLIDFVVDPYGRQYLRIERSENEHGLYNLSLHPIIPCDKNYIYFQHLAMGGPITVKWNNKEVISYLLDDGRLIAI